MLNLLLLSLLTDKNVLLQPIFILLSLIGIQLYIFTDVIEIKNVLKQLKISYCSTIRNEEQSGTLIGKWFIGYMHDEISSEKRTQIFYLITRTKNYIAIKKMIDDKRFNINNDNYNDNHNDNTTKTEQYKVKIWNSSGSKWWRDYHSFIVDLSYLIPFEQQIKIIKDIKDLYKINRSRSVVVYIYGEPGAGKTSIGLLLAKEFTSHYYDGWKPLAEGNIFANFHSHITPDEEKPLIVCVNEIDTYIDKLDKQEPIKDVERQFDGKADWNNFFDSVGIGIYPYTIIITTGNTPISKIDNSLMRKGRFDLIIKMDNCNKKCQ
jgi:hypothetical protein